MNINEEIDFQILRDNLLINNKNICGWGIIIKILIKITNKD